MNVGKCSECSNEPWPSCGAATNCCFSPYQKTGTMMYPVRGCASHYQPRQERRCDNCGTNLGGIFICKNGGSDPACEAWTPRPVVSHEPASGETQGPQCLTGETDERVKKGENLARWFENRPGGYTCKGQPTIDSAVIVTALRGLLAVVEEQKKRGDQFAVRWAKLSDADRLRVKAEQERDSAQNELDLFGYKVGELEHERDAALAKVEEMKFKCDEYDKANSPKYHGHGYSLQEELDYLRAENEGMKEHHNSARAERDEYFAERNKFAAESSRLQIERDELEQERDSALARVAELEAQLGKRGKVEVEGVIRAKEHMTPNETADHEHKYRLSILIPKEYFDMPEFGLDRKVTVTAKEGQDELVR